MEEDVHEPVASWKLISVVKTVLELDDPEESVSILPWKNPGWGIRGLDSVDW
jgi:hypothetical protein